MQPVDPLAVIVHKDSAYKVGKALATRLKELIPRQQFKVPIQAAIGARIVASESISGMSGGFTLCLPFLTIILPHVLGDRSETRVQLTFQMVLHAPWGGWICKRSEHQFDISAIYLLSAAQPACIVHDCVNGSSCT